MEEKFEEEKKEIVNKFMKILSEYGESATPEEDLMKFFSEVDRAIERMEPWDRNSLYRGLAASFRELSGVYYEDDNPIFEGMTGAAAVMIQNRIVERKMELQTPPLSPPAVEPTSKGGADEEEEEESVALDSTQSVLERMECPNGHSEFGVEIRRGSILVLKCTTCGVTQSIAYHECVNERGPWVAPGEESG